MENGIYRARAKSWALAEAKTGSVQVAVLFELLTEGMVGQTITWYGFWTDKTWERTVESLKYCGWEGDDPSDLQGLDKNEVDLVVENESYEDEQGITRTRPRVRWVNRPGGLAIAAPLAPDKAKAFAAEFRDRIRALNAQDRKFASSKPSKPSKPQSKPSGPIGPEPPPFGDADIPF